MSLRPSELAGSFYPSSADACRAAMQGHPPLSAPEGSVQGALVPHGGWRYAGRILIGTLRTAAARCPDPNLLVVLGGHLDPGEPVRIFIEGDWDSPLGPVPTPTALAESLAMALSAEPETAEEYYDDNAVEVLMPVLAGLWPRVPALTVGVPPDADTGSLAIELRDQIRVRGYERPFVIGSVDLTHYGPDHRFRPHGGGPEAHRWALEENDRALLARLLRLDHHGVAFHGPRERNTCSAGSAAVATALAKKWGATSGVCLAQSSSWLEDGCPEDSRSFVGYAGVLFGAFQNSPTMTPK